MLLEVSCIYGKSCAAELSCSLYLWFHSHPSRVVAGVAEGNQNMQSQAATTCLSRFLHDKKDSVCMLAQSECSLYAGKMDVRNRLPSGCPSTKHDEYCCTDSSSEEFIHEVAYVSKYRPFRFTTILSPFAHWSPRPKNNNAATNHFRCLPTHYLPSKR